ncbi:ABC transporter permease [Nocardioides sp. LHD-245]|uniref:ABC transporter permease n=1 Tax=Nocardioides sp. LHD-245 TaxID=3051387 RepID=UPI0027E0273F|nr:ABC transporter permease [Nocardioides sp. LHD-245]
MRIVRYLGLRLALLVPTLLGVVVLSFVLVRVLPGDPLAAFVTPSTTSEDIEKIRQRLGLDVSMWEQFTTYVGGLFRGDLGTSIQSGSPITTELSTRFGPTMELVVISVVISLLLALVLGVWSALRANRPEDHVIRVGSLVGTALPEFWLGLILIAVFYKTLHWFPAPSGRVDRGVDLTSITGAEGFDALLAGNLTALSSALAHLVLPVATIVIGISASLMRHVRASAIEILASPTWRTAQAHGVRRGALLRGYLLRGTAARLPTLVAIVLGNVLGGVVLVEYVFSWQGMGQWLLRGLLYRDYPVIQAGVLISAVVFAVAYLVADLVQALLDPRVKL